MMLLKIDSSELNGVEPYLMLLYIISDENLTNEKKIIKYL